MWEKTRYLRIPKEIIDKSIESKLLHEIIVVSAGFRCGFNTSIGYDVQRYPGEEYLVKYCASGYGWLEAEGLEYRIGPGDIVICRDSASHGYGADPGNPWSVYWAYFKGKSASDYFNSVFSPKGRHVVRIGYDSFLEQYFRNIILTMEKGYAPNYMLHVSNLLKAIFSHTIIMLEPPGRNSGKESEFEELIRYMLENLHKTLTLNQIAKKAGMSKDHFTKVFSKRYGYTPVDYFIRMKMQKACELLVTTGHTIYQIAGGLGYNDCYYFSRLFKKKTGISPGQFRRKYS